jgi:hypothetical protein
VASLISDRDATAEAIRLDQATIEELRDRLKGSGDELAAMTLQLEEARRRAEETLTLLAAADAAKEDLQSRLNENLSEAEKAAALRATAEKALQDPAADLGPERRTGDAAERAGGGAAHAAERIGRGFSMPRRRRMRRRRCRWKTSARS